MTGPDVDYNGQPAGYAADPSETVTYVDAHDNETLFDALQYKLPQDTPMADRVRMNTVSLATTAFAQGIGFWHAGTDLLRSKSLDRNSLRLRRLVQPDRLVPGRVHLGLGPAAARRQRDQVGIHAPVAGRPRPGAGRRPTSTRPPTGRPSCCGSEASSPLFRLDSAADDPAPASGSRWAGRQTPGVIVMTLDDTAGRDLDRRWERHRGGLQRLGRGRPPRRCRARPGRSYALHPVQASGGDPVVKGAHYAGGGAFTVPARTVAVFVA